MCAVQVEQREREELMVGASHTGHPGDDAKEVAGASAAVAGVHSVLGDTKNALAERGEKIAELADKVQGVRV